MATTVPLRFYRYQTNGQTYYDVLPQYGNISGKTEVTDLNEVNQAISQYSAKTDDWSQNYVNTLKSGLQSVQSGSSPYVLNDQGVLATQDEVAAQQQQAQQIASGQATNIGTQQAPLTVPPGSAGAQLSQALAGQQPAIQQVQTQTGQIATPDQIAQAQANPAQGTPETAVGGVLQPQNQPNPPPTQANIQPSLMEGGSYTVMPGDTLSAIAKKLGVPIASITGYRSGNPNLIYPGEKLSVAGTSQTMPSPTGGSSTGGTPTGTPTPSPNLPGGSSAPNAPETPSPQDFTKTYTDTLNNLGVSSIKSQFDKVNKEFEDLQLELNDKIVEINDNPWISEGLRLKRIDKEKERYEGRLNIKTNQLKLYDSLYQQGLAEARFLTTGEVSSQQWASEQSQKAYDAALKIQTEIASGKYKNIKEVNGGLYDLDNEVWVIPPKADDGGYKPPTSYQEWELAGGKAGTGKTYGEWVAQQNVKPATINQQTLATYAARLEQANPTIDELEDYVVALNPISFEAQLRLPSYLQEARFQQYMQAARNMVNSVLRRESGAVISPSEFDNAYKQYLPRAGDDEKTLSQKSINRQINYNSFKSGAGSAYQSIDELLGGGSSIADPLGLGL